MDCATFRKHVLTHIDGELSGAEQGAAETHETSCADCAELANAERVFEERSRSAMLAGVQDAAFAGLLSAARERATQPAGGRVVRSGDRPRRSRRWRRSHSLP